MQNLNTERAEQTTKRIGQFFRNTNPKASSSFIRSSFFPCSDFDFQTVPPNHYHLARFLTAQFPIYSRVLAELRAGEKRSHWMWFIFPQLAGLGHSQMSQTYAISSLDEGHAYLAHPVLGARLRECTAFVNTVEDRTIHQIFGSPDDMKFHS